VQATLKLSNRAGRADATNSGEGASVNAYADRTVASDERLISLAGNDMREVTTASVYRGRNWQLQTAQAATRPR
jgi:hypothetical protein